MKELLYLALKTIKLYRRSQVTNLIQAYACRNWRKYIKDTVVGLELSLNVFYIHLYRAAHSNSPHYYKFHRSFSKKIYIHQTPEDDKRLHFHQKWSVNPLQVQRYEQGLGSLSHSMTELRSIISNQQVFSSRLPQIVLHKIRSFVNAPVELLVTGCVDAKMLSEFKRQLEKFTEKLQGWLKLKHYHLLSKILPSNSHQQGQYTTEASLHACAILSFPVCA